LVPLLAATLIGTASGLPSSILQDEAGGTGAAPAGRKIVPEATMTSLCIKQVSPNFPPQAQAKGAQVVVLQVVVRSNGTVHPVRIVSGNPSLEPEAMDAVRLWRYRPYMQDGQPIDVMTNVRVDFIPGKLGGMVSHPGH
jgi:protein TonB